MVILCASIGLVVLIGVSEDNTTCLYSILLASHLHLWFVEKVIHWNRGIGINMGVSGDNTFCIRSGCASEDGAVRRVAYNYMCIQGLADYPHALICCCSATLSGLLSSYVCPRTTHCASIRAVRPRTAHSVGNTYLHPTPLWFGENDNMVVHGSWGIVTGAMCVCAGHTAAGHLRAA